MKASTAKQPLSIGNEAVATNIQKELAKLPDVGALVLYLGQLCDHLARGGDGFITVGANRNRTKLLLTVGLDGEREWLDAGSLIELLNLFQTLL